MSKEITFAVAVMMLLIGFGLGDFIGSKRQSGDHRLGNDQSVNQPRPEGVDMHMMPGMSGTSSTDMSMEAMMISMKGDLEGKTGDAFDQTFLSEMIVHHQGAVDMANQVLVQAKHEELKDFARGIIAAQSKEIQEMKDWSKLWYGK